jgi:hypothetical protein
VAATFFYFFTEREKPLIPPPTAPRFPHRPHPPPHTHTLSLLSLFLRPSYRTPCSRPLSPPKYVVVSFSRDGTREPQPPPSLCLCLCLCLCLFLSRAARNRGTTYSRIIFCFYFIGLMNTRPSPRASRGSST